MADNSLLEEIWQAREEIARECDFDSHRIADYIRRIENEAGAAGANLCRNARIYAETHPEPQQVPFVSYEPLRPNPILEEIYRMRAEMARERTTTEPALIREEPPIPPGDTATRP